jgi:hypothetical protein
MLNRIKDSWTKDKGLVLTWPRDEKDKKTNGQLTKDKGLVLTWPQDKIVISPSDFFSQILTC